MLHRRVTYYSLLSSYVADAYASKGESIMHLTLWSWFLQMIYFELPLGGNAKQQQPQEGTPTTPPWLVQLVHGPAFCGAHALFGMYLWTLYANPSMEFDLAPAGRPAWLVLARAAWLHVAPVAFQWVDLLQCRRLLRRTVYESRTFLSKNKYLLYFWASVGGYFAMGLTWEQVNGNAAGTYNVTTMSAETYVLVSKIIGVASCLVSFAVGFKPLLLDNNEEEQKKKN